MNAQYIVPPTPPATNGTYTGRSFLSVTPAGVNAFVIYYIVVKNNAKPVASLTEVGVWPLFIPLNPCFLKKSWQKKKYDSQKQRFFRQFKMLQKEKKWDTE